jgi:hypothetical protein
VAGDECRRRRATVLPRPIRHRVDHEQRRLGELREAELGARIFETEVTDRIAEHVIGGSGPVGKPIEQFGAHALGLGALTRKETDS